MAWAKVQADAWDLFRGGRSVGRVRKIGVGHYWALSHVTGLDDDYNSLGDAKSHVEDQYRYGGK